MEELIACIAKALVQCPEAVTVTKIQKKGLEVYELHVAPEDMGKVIGKQGRVAKSIRTVMKSVSAKENKKVNIEFID